MNTGHVRYFSGLAILLWLPIAALGNAGPPPSGSGATVGEPSGLKDVAITKETLTIDLRPLADAKYGLVETIYHLDNRGDERTVELFFASGSDVAEFSVWLDNRPIDSRPAGDAKLPESWRPPKQTPGIHDSNPIHYRGERDVKPLAFTVVLRPGVQTLKVSYQAKVAFQLRDTPTYYWQFIYVVAPAKEWASFGGLELSVHLPEGWHAAALPRLTRDGDMFRGTFTELPADAIALTLQAPPGVAYQLLDYGSKGLLILVGAAGVFMCGWVGASKGQNGTLAFALGIAWGLAVLGAGILAIEAPSHVLPAHQQLSYGYGGAFAMIGVFILSLLVVPIGFMICMFAAGSGNRRHTPSPDASQNL